ncbi:ATP-binding protein [Nocardia implantans]|uniref:ATP-binding protein n=1 Tax=Nocardia implantans TaxID=3108168 RepID=A0ABU6B538_9NOCA|nr:MULTISPECIES: ATP-binding protein [unclassified Nocardia]MBF6196307.1 ATP-binding protein [Nocardia beijingensis]MEA3527726.1 ATP-binding protein [Nocardia sp. CDC192]MEB3514568.1 ATP-binding protein [Nocardia sp. CDC186]
MGVSTLDAVRADERAEGAVVEWDLEVVSLGQLRAAVRRLLAPLAGIGVEDAVQVCDELASNAVVHARAPRGCRLTVAGHGGWLRVEVEDASPAPARMRRPDHTGGRGLILVDQLATCWGVDYHGPGKTVWAELGTRCGG